MFRVGPRDLIDSHLDLVKLLDHVLLEVEFAVLRHKQVFLKLLFQSLRQPSIVMHPMVLSKV